MGSVNLPALADATIYKQQPDTNYGSLVSITTNGSLTYDSRICIRPNLSSLPTGVVITSVKLHLYVRSDAVAGTVTDYAYRLRRVFVENQVTWNSWSSGNGWTTAGAESTVGDRYSTLMGSVTHSIVNGWIEINLDVNEFRALITSNTGILIKRSDTNNTNKTHQSRDNASNTPYFEVEYTLGGAQAVWFT